MKKNIWNDWKRTSYTKNGWVRFRRISPTGKIWHKVNFGLYSPYDTKVYKFGRYNSRTGKIKFWK